MKRVLAAAAALCCATLATQASAGVIYQQPLGWTNGTPVTNGWTSQIMTGNSGYKSYDDFTLTADAVVREVTWYGTYLSADAQGLHAGAENTDSWEVSFYDDNNAGAPDGLVFSTSVPVTKQLLGTSQFGNTTISVYSFTANIGAFSASGATKYWFSPVSHSASFSPFFSWINGSGGDNATFQQMLDNGSLVGNFRRGGDRAFTLRDTVPEPASLALLGAGVAMVLARRRRA